MHCIGPTIKTGVSETRIKIGGLQNNSWSCTRTVETDGL